MENGVNGRREQSLLALRMRHGCTGRPPPLTALLHRVAD